MNIENYQLETLKKYLHLVLGEDITFKKFGDIKALKPYLRNSFDLRITSILGKDILFVFVTKFSAKDLEQLEKQLYSIYQSINKEYEIVCIFDELTLYYRKKLIEDHLPFIVPGKQVYMPFIGLFYLETGSNFNLKLGYQEKIEIKKDFSCASGRLFVGLLTAEFKNSRIKTLSKKTGISTMSVSRALEELVNKGILNKKSQGRRNIYKLKENPTDLWLQFKSHLVPFYKKTIRINPKDYLELREKYELRESRALLLSKISNLAKPKVASYAIHKKNIVKESSRFDIVSEEIVFYNKSIELDLWEVELLPKEQDIFKLFQVYSSMRCSEDARIEKSINNIEQSIQAYLKSHTQINGWF